ncbi:DinB family protein [Deinococcus enclensis]|uniref:Damage-inducible protein DinB n=1 Tax=Deinococcus enclensis TaxID=1049582 RepID=A0ABT9MF31_9DEIO|nr:DinB family protein [Deinococcus enclensis]MDP9765200.1 putative damage-inducible protein DinB [Deinococcus enclensis]
MTQEQPTRLTSYLPKEIFYTSTRTFEEDLNGAREGMTAFLAWLERVPAEDFHVPVAPGKWSPAEFADHLAKGNRLFTRRLLEHQDGQRLEDVGYGAVFPDGRVVAHAGMEPTPGRNREDLVAELRASAAALEEAMQEYRQAGRLDEVCVPHQYFGPLTARETMQLAMVHYLRHLGQLQPS